MPEQVQQQQNKNPIQSGYRALDQNLLGGMAPGGANPFYTQGVNQFNQGRDISQQNGGGGIRQAGRGLVNVIDGNLLGGMIPGGVKPSEVFMGQPAQGKNPRGTQGNNQTTPPQPQNNQQQPSIYNRLDGMMGNRLPGGVPHQSQGKNPSGGSSVSAQLQAGLPGPVALPNPSGNTEIDRLDTGVAPPRGNQSQSQTQQNKNPSGSNSPMTDATLGSPMPNRFNSPVADLFNSMMPMTGSGQGFDAARNYYASIQRPNPNIIR